MIQEVVTQINPSIVMKTIIIRKSLDFSSNSKIYLHIGAKKIHIKGFGSYSFTE
jgi:hypothetical protein